MDLPIAPLFVSVLAFFLAFSVDMSAPARLMVRLFNFGILFALPTLLAWAIWLVVALQQCKG